jgi:hypothetical protein
VRKEVKTGYIKMALRVLYEGVQCGSRPPLAVARRLSNSNLET